MFGLPGPVWTLMLVQVVSVAMLIFGIVAPVHPEHNVVLKFAAATVGLALFSVLLVLRDRTPAWLLWGQVFVQLIVTGVLISAAPTDAGAVSLMIGLVSVGVYAGFWGSRRVIIAVMAAIVLAGTLGILVGGRFNPSLASAWVTIAIFGIALVFVIHALVSALEQQALIDPLTGVMNRRGLRALTQMRQASGSSVQHRSIALIDVDDFKCINDDRGHAEGDRVLRDLADYWVAGLRSEDLVVRLGGDEFVLVFSRVEPDAAEELIGRLRNGSPVPWSYGIASWPEGAAFDACLRDADMRLLEAKRLRRRGRDADDARVDA